MGSALSHWDQTTNATDKPAAAMTCTRAQAMWRCTIEAGLTYGVNRPGAATGAGGPPPTKPNP